MGVRLLLGGKMELNSTYYKNYQPNSRITPLGTAQQNVKNELAAIFPLTFNINGTDVEKGNNLRDRDGANCEPDP